MLEQIPAAGRTADTSAPHSISALPPPLLRSARLSSDVAEGNRAVSTSCPSRAQPKHAEGWHKGMTCFAPKVTCVTLDTAMSHSQAPAHTEPRAPPDGSHGLDCPCTGRGDRKDCCPQGRAHHGFRFHRGCGSGRGRRRSSGRTEVGTGRHSVFLLTPTNHRGGSPITPPLLILSPLRSLVQVCKSPSQSTTKPRADELDRDGSASPCVSPDC